MNTDYHHIDYNYAYFNLNWTWIKDKEIIHQGNEESGMLIIVDADGNMVKWYGYERVK